MTINENVVGLIIILTLGSLVAFTISKTLSYDESRTPSIQELNSKVEALGRELGYEYEAEYTKTVPAKWEKDITTYAFIDNSKSYAITVPESYTLPKKKRWFSR